MKSILVVCFLATAAGAADGPALLTPNSENGVPIVYRAARFDVPPGTAVRVEVSLAKDGTECFDTSIIDWHKEMVEGKRFHAINFDAARSKTSGKQPEGCPKRESERLGLHTVDLPAEKGPMHVSITYREGEEVRATFGKSFPTEGVTPGLPARDGKPSKKGD